jgi:indolepyruvate ferredoxin oxidoreductase beta subunit
MAQRGGVVECDILMGDVASPIISDGEADVLLGFEPLETLRSLARCNRRTLIITNDQPLPPFTVSIGRGEYPPVADILGMIRSKVERVITLSGNELAERAGNPRALNMVMLGALIGTGGAVVTEAAMRKVISNFGKRAFTKANLKAFEMGMEAVGH